MTSPKVSFRLSVARLALLVLMLAVLPLYAADIALWWLMMHINKRLLWAVLGWNGFWIDHQSSAAARWNRLTAWCAKVGDFEHGK